jgi:glycosyltransferase involved in cell wall biosynthesis
MHAAPTEARSEPTPPRVSVVIPCRNEAAFIDETLATIREGTFADIEVLVVDGRSGDGSRERIAAHAEADPRVRLLDNPSGTTPAALNIGVRAARGDIIVRVDCHSGYPPTYVAAMVQALEASGADMVGGRVENVPASPGAIPRAIAIALTSPFGTGSPFRYRAQDGDVDGVQLGCWRRELFDDVGMFDERLIRNQDNEHSARIIFRGGRVHLTSAVAVRYHPRSTLAALARQARLNGTWNAFTEWLHPYTFRWRHLLPGVFFLGVVLALIMCALALVSGDAAWAKSAALLVAPYAVVNVVASAIGAWRAQRLRLWPLVALSLWVWHFVYGFGIVRGWVLVASGGWRRHLGGGAVGIAR